MTSKRPSPQLMLCTFSQQVPPAHYWVSSALMRLKPLRWPCLLNAFVKRHFHHRIEGNMSTRNGLHIPKSSFAYLVSPELQCPEIPFCHRFLSILKNLHNKSHVIKTCLSYAKNRLGSACVFAQSDQRLCCSLPR